MGVHIFWCDVFIGVKSGSESSAVLFSTAESLLFCAVIELYLFLEMILN